MAEKISTEKKLQYQQMQKEFKARLPEIMVRMQRLEKDNKEEEDKEIIYYRNIAISNLYLDAVEVYCNMIKSYNDFNNKVNETDLKEARELYFKALVSLENVVGKYVSITLTENVELLESIHRLNPKRKLMLIRKFENRLRLLEECYGDMQKYKWHLVEMEGRFTTVAKNLMNFKELQVGDPRIPYYAENQALLTQIKQYLRKTSEKYRDKYNQTNKEAADMKRAIAYQEALKSICMVLGNPQETENAKKVIDSWNAILDKEEKDKEKRLKSEQIQKHKKSSN